MLIKKLQGNLEFTVGTATAFHVTLLQWHVTFIWAYNLALKPLSTQIQAHLQKSRQVKETRMKPTWNQALQQLKIWRPNLRT